MKKILFCLMVLLATFSSTFAIGKTCDHFDRETAQKLAELNAYFSRYGTLEERAMLHLIYVIHSPHNARVERPMSEPISVAPADAQVANVTPLTSYDCVDLLAMIAFM